MANFLDINLQKLSKRRKIKYIGIGTDGDSRAYSVMKMELEKSRPPHQLDMSNLKQGK